MAALAERLVVTLARPGDPARRSCRSSRTHPALPSGPRSGGPFRGGVHAKESGRPPHLRLHVETHECADLHELVRQGQVGDSHDRAGGPVLPEILGVKVCCRVEVLPQVPHQNRGLHYLATLGSKLPQHQIQILQRGADLQFEVAYTHEVAVTVMRQLPRHVNRLTDLGGLAVPVQRLPRHAEPECLHLRTHDSLP
ncbi:hypothetical protein SVEN_6174 [Streptomyces venezuelae ATCC 10712]|uniref:Uncharacterized protein n=1 Tax=Streptomyces venezuelae (strain ATCC 10712 / CBS 650.69 / DSM 40230 / JCM 4526 / NBRC 13096 / PD 04745) TaxID=953739 RepID=F2RDG8_STRVP|nr:hypothetical protein SVEN_6174 [Streptomyces venezuelae ATCC 10712]